MRHADEYVCMCTHTIKNHFFPESTAVACNYFLNGQPCVYQNVNVCIITGSTMPVRMSRLSPCQSSLKIALQISMQCCHAKWQTEPPHSLWADKYTNFRQVHWVELFYQGAHWNWWSFGHRQTSIWMCAPKSREQQTRIIDTNRGEGAGM